MRYVRAVCVGLGVGLVANGSLVRACAAGLLLLVAFWLTDDIHDKANRP